MQFLMLLHFVCIHSGHFYIIATVHLAGTLSKSRLSGSISSQLLSFRLPEKLSTASKSRRLVYTPRDLRSSDSRESPRSALLRNCR